MAWLCLDHLHVLRKHRMQTELFEHSCMSEHSRTYPQAMVACAFNGLGLALVIPCLQSLTADFHPPESRGRAFGWMFCVSSIGRAVLPPAVA